jgi:ADP-ribose pyrophosphatase YjhB (NUDIX family)
MTPAPPARVRLAVALGGVLSPEGLLLIRREKPPYQGLWGLPGGKIEPGETPRAAIRREVFEECGVRLTGTRELGRLIEDLDDGGRSFRFDLHLFRADLPSPAARPAPTVGAEGHAAFHALSRLDERPAAYIPTDLLIIRHIILPAETRDHRTWVVREGDTYIVRHFGPAEDPQPPLP